MFVEFKKSMMDEFDMTNLGKMRYFVCIEVVQSPTGIFIGQRKYAQEILERFQMNDCNFVQNPIVPNCKLTKDEGVRINSTFYKQIVGNLMYLSATQLDMMFVVSHISKFMKALTELHLQATKIVF